jgi:hypothetical protein
MKSKIKDQTIIFKQIDIVNKIKTLMNKAKKTKEFYMAKHYKKLFKINIQINTNQFKKKTEKSYSR